MDYVEDKGDWDYKNCTFQEAPKELLLYNPDLVVMDWMYDAENTHEGDPIFKALYENDFVPVIVFSAIASTISDDVVSIAEGNPMIEILPKGDEQVVIDKIEQWEPYIQAVKESKKELNSSLLLSAKAMAYYFSINNLDVDIVKYMLRKRIQSAFPKDEEDFFPPAWMEYEYPPISKTLMAADILRKNNNNNCSSIAKATQYCVVLTPSCDMARAKPNKKILVAECKAAKDLYYSSGNMPSGEELHNLVTRYIHTGYNYAKVPLPELPTKIPYMTIDLKSLSLIDLADIALDEQAKEEKAYFRVASMSSPFRESVMWAHMINSCRPGMPDRDVTTWVNNIIL
jgi:hypothetical protein